MEFTELPIYMCSQLFNPNSAFGFHLDDLLLEGSFNSTKELSFHQEKRLFPSFMVELLCCVSCSYHLNKGFLDGHLETLLGDSGIVEELTSTFAASDHLWIEEIRIYIWVVLENIIAVGHRQCLELYLLLR